MSRDPIPAVLQNLLRRFTSGFKRAAENPDEPWLWRSEWARGELRYSEWGRVASPLALGVLILVLSAPAVWINWDAIVNPPFLNAATTLLFPAAAVVFLIVAVFRVFRWRRYGETTARLLTNPGVIGGWLRLDVDARLRPAPSDRLLATLKCMYRSRSSNSSSGSKSSTHVVWRLDQELNTRAVKVNDDRRVTFPVSFYIPYDCIETSRSLAVMGVGGKTEYYWELELRARVDGPNFYAKFLVPIYKTDESELEIPREAVELFGDAIAKKEDYQETSRARVDVLPGGGLEVTTRPVRFLPVAIVATLFAMACGCWSYMLFGEPGWLIIPKFIALSLTSVMTLLVGWMWFGARRLVLEDGQAIFEKRIVALQRSRVFSLADVRAVHCGVGGRLNGKEQWQIALTFGEHEKLFASGLEAGEARWLATLVREHIQKSTGSEIALVNDKE